MNNYSAFTRDENLRESLQWSVFQVYMNSYRVCLGRDRDRYIEIVFIRMIEKLKYCEMKKKCATNYYMNLS